MILIRRYEREREGGYKVRVMRDSSAASAATQASERGACLSAAEV